MGNQHHLTSYAVPEGEESKNAYNNSQQKQI